MTGAADLQGQALAAKGSKESEVEKDIMVGLAVRTVVINCLVRGYACVPVP